MDTGGTVEGGGMGSLGSSERDTERDVRITVGRLGPPKVKRGKERMKKNRNVSEWV